MRLYLKNLLTLVAVLLMHITPHVNARWASTADMAYKINVLSSVININKNGGAEEEITIEYEVLKESGRYTFAQYALSYNADNGSLTVLEAKTIYNGKDYIVGKDLIEDKPVASNPNGFDEMRQLSIAFPNVKVGARVRLKYKLTTLQSPVKGQYSTSISFGKHKWLESANIKLNSEIPLYYVHNDPHSVLNIKCGNKDAQGRVKKIEVKLKKPVLQATVGEYISAELSLVPNHDLFTWISVSSVNTWKPLGEALSVDYAKIYTEKLPASFVAILNAAKQQTNEVDQINTVTSMLNDKVQYMGDRRTVKGRYIPRDLSVIADRQLGDCKGFSASTAAILNQMGYKVSVAFVWRGLETERSNKALPSLSMFNHAMLKVTGPSGKVYWIDPTNVVSMAGGIFPDIANKPVLVLDHDKSEYSNIPQIDINSSRVKLNKVFELCGEQSVKATFQVTLFGEAAMPYTALGLFLSKEMIENSAYRWLSGRELAPHQKLGVKVPDLNTRIVKAIDMGATFNLEDLFTLTNAGRALGVSHKMSVINELVSLNETYVSDVVINTVRSDRVEVLIKNIKPKNIEALNKVIDSPWLLFSRKLEQTNEGVKIVYEYAVKQPIIYNAELKGKAFKHLKAKLKQFFVDVYLLP